MRWLALCGIAVKATGFPPATMQGAFVRAHWSSSKAHSATSSTSSSRRPRRRSPRSTRSYRMSARFHARRIAVTGDYHGQERELARVEIGITAADIEEAVIKLVIPWQRDFRDLSILISSAIEGIGLDLAQVKGFRRRFLK